MITASVAGMNTRLFVACLVAGMARGAALDSSCRRTSAFYVRGWVIAAHRSILLCSLGLAVDSSGVLLGISVGHAAFSAGWLTAWACTDAQIGSVALRHPICRFMVF